jgi:hypothetical protein
MLAALGVYYCGTPFAPLPALPMHQQQAATPVWSPWTGTWDQKSLPNYFNTMTLTPPAVTILVVDSDVSNHTTLYVSNLTIVYPPNSISPSSIIDGNRTTLPVTSVGDTTLLSPFYLNDIFIVPDII